MTAPRHFRFSARLLSVCVGICAALFVASTSRCTAQQISPNQQVAAATAAAHTITYEPGDVYLPNSRVYIHVDKTGLGHEHGVVGQIKQGESISTRIRSGGFGVRYDIVHSRHA